MYIHSQILSSYKHGLEQDFEVCAIRLSCSSVNLCVLSVYRSLSGNFDTFIVKLQEILNILREFYSLSPQQIFTRIFVLLHVSVSWDHHQANSRSYKNHFYFTSKDLCWLTLKYSICVNRFAMCVVWVYGVCVLCVFRL
jgi:hypothetical protein